jgi:hypothetical protein
VREKDKDRLIENRELRTLGPKINTGVGDWRRDSNKDLHKVYSSPDSIRVIEPGKMILVLFVARKAFRNFAESFEENKLFVGPRLL